MAIETVARQYGLGFIPLQDELYDFVIPDARRDRPGVRLFIESLASPEVAAALTAIGFRPAASTPDHAAGSNSLL
jgi:putative molybdopterin biosynthesis protein